MRLIQALRVASVSLCLPIAVASCSSSEPSAVPRTTRSPEPGSSRSADAVVFPFVNGTVSSPGTSVYLAGGLTADSRPRRSIGTATGNPEVVRLGPGAVPDLRWTIDLAPDEMLRSAAVVELLAGRFLAANRCSGIGWTEDAGWHCGPTAPAIWRLNKDGSGELVRLSGPLLDREPGTFGTWISIVGTLDGLPLITAREAVTETVGADLVQLYQLDVETGATSKVTLPVPLQREGQACTAEDGTLRLLEARVAPDATVDAVRVHHRRPDATWSAGPWVPLDAPFSLNAELACVGDVIAAYETYGNRMALINGATGQARDVILDREWEAATRITVRRFNDRLLVAAESEDLTTASYRWVDARGTVTPFGSEQAQLHRPNIPTPVLLNNEVWDITGLVAGQPGLAAIPLS